MSPTCGRVGRIAQALLLTVILPLSFLPACSSEENGNGPPTGPEAPGAVTVTATTDANTVDLSWGASSGATSYQATLVNGGATLTETVTAPTTQVQFTEDDGLEDGVTYTASVTSINADGETPSANSPTVTTNFFPWDENFPTSLHETGRGMEEFYLTSNGGFEQYVGVSYDALACKGCHSQASGLAPVNGRGCERCHDTADPQLGAEVDATLTGTCGGSDNCHGRQVAEVAFYSDVHRDAGMDCSDCHGLTDMHGDGNTYASMLEEGAIDVACEDCHSDVPAGHDGHGGALDCSSCHMQAVVSCYNCHFDTEVAGGGKVSYGKFKDWLFLVNRDGEVHPANFQSLKYGSGANASTFVAFAPFYSHTITADGRSCGDCHGNDAVEDWEDDGVIDVVTWDAATSSLVPITGVIPVPPNYMMGGMRFDFVDQPTPAQPGPTAPWSFLETGPDAFQLLYGEPLTQAQMDDLQ